VEKAKSEEEEFWEAVERVTEGKVKREDYPDAFAKRRGFGAYTKFDK
jgi:hypothetical protein